jgi:hypothetical protein
MNEVIVFDDLVIAAAVSPVCAWSDVRPLVPRDLRPTLQLGDRVVKRRELTLGFGMALVLDRKHVDAARSVA